MSTKPVLEREKTIMVKLEKRLESFPMRRLDIIHTRVVHFRAPYKVRNKRDFKYCEQEETYLK